MVRFAARCTERRSPTCRRALCRTDAEAKMQILFNGLVYQKGGALQRTMDKYNVFHGFCPTAANCEEDHQAILRRGRMVGRFFNLRVVQSVGWNAFWN